MRMADCHPERKYHSRGMCHQCYNRQYREGNIETAKLRDKKKYETNKEFMINQARVGRYKNRYGMTPDDYDRMFIKQAGACAICGNPELSKHRLSIDHDHKTGNIRGLLCKKHNNGLGCFSDDISLLKSAIKYLQENS